MNDNRVKFWLLLFFIISVVIRLPHLNRPLSKHHEFNPAVILIGLESWKQAGGAGNFHFIPLLTYQNPSDRLLQKGPYIDSKGNQIYLSFGPGWYIIPYLVFDTFQIPFTPLALQVLNLFFLLISVIFLFRLSSYLFARTGYQSQFPALATCFIYLFNPAILWFMGNGYVCTGIVMPFLIAIIYYGTKLLCEPGTITGKNLVAYFLAGIAAIYIDWFGVSFLSIISLFALYRVRSNKRYQILFWLSCLTIIIGIGSILFQFASYAGWQTVYDYWTSRYLERGVAGTGQNKLSYLLGIIKHLATGFLPVILLLLIGWIFIRKTGRLQPISRPVNLAIQLSFFSCILHAILFLDWSGGHDFAVIPWSLPLALAGGWIASRIPYSKIAFGAILLFLISVTQYYVINFPGKKTITGLPYDSYKKAGIQIGKMTDDGERIFCNEDYVIYQFYAKRNFTIVASYEEALKWSRQYRVKKGVWIKLSEAKDRILIEEVKHF